MHLDFYFVFSHFSVFHGWKMEQDDRANSLQEVVVPNGMLWNLSCYEICSTFLLNMYDCMFWICIVWSFSSNYICATGNIFKTKSHVLNQFVNDIKYDFDSILISFSSNSMYASVIIENLTHIILNQFVNDVKSSSYDFNVLFRKKNSCKNSGTNNK